MAGANTASNANLFGAARWRRWRDSETDASAYARSADLDAAVARRINAHRIFNRWRSARRWIVRAPRALAIFGLLFKRLARTIGGTIAAEAVEAIQCALEQRAIYGQRRRCWDADSVGCLDARRGWAGAGRRGWARRFGYEHANARVSCVSVFNDA